MENLVEILKNKPELIIKVLEETGFFNITLNNNEQNIRCAIREDGNPTSVSINCETLQAYIFSRDVGGLLPMIIAKKYNWSIPYTISYIYQILGINQEKALASIPFGGLLKRNRYKRTETNEEFDNTILNNFPQMCNVRFLEDNIDLKTQNIFDLRYNFEENRIIIPWRDEEGAYLGYSARLNFDNTKGEPKYKSSIGLKKSNHLYGLYENSPFLKDYDYIVLCEAEKSVLQAYSFGIHNVFALGGNHISDKQARIIKSMPIKKVIIGFDEGLSVELLLKEAEKLKGGIFNNLKEIFVVYDKGEILGVKSKNSPTDLGKDKFELLLDKYCFRKD